MELTYADSMIILSTILFVWVSFLLTLYSPFFRFLFLRKGLRLKHEFLVWKPNKSFGERVLFEPVTSILVFRGFLISAQSFPSIGSLNAQRSASTGISLHRRCTCGHEKWNLHIWIQLRNKQNRQQFLRLPNFQPWAISGIHFPILVRDKSGYVLLAHS
jgi:hypothetical protein